MKCERRGPNMSGTKHLELISRYEAWKRRWLILRLRPVVPLAWTTHLPRPNQRLHRNDLNKLQKDTATDTARRDSHLNQRLIDPSVHHRHRSDGCPRWLIDNLASRCLTVSFPTTTRATHFAQFTRQDGTRLHIHCALKLQLAFVLC